MEGAFAHSPRHRGCNGRTMGQLMTCFLSIWFTLYAAFAVALSLWIVTR